MTLEKTAGPMSEPINPDTPKKTSGAIPERAPARSPAPRSHWIILGLILALGAFLRFYGLAHQSIWLDEAKSIQIAQKNPVDIIEGLKSDSHPPLFYFILHVWMKLFGSSETAVRALPALFG